MRFEKERTFEVSKRLVRWSNNDLTSMGNNLIQVNSNLPATERKR